MTMTSQFSDITLSSIFFRCYFVSPMKFSLFQVSCQYHHWFWSYDNFLWDWPELLSEFYPISGDWGKLGIPNLARVSLIKCYWMLQNARLTAFTVSELLRENQQGVKFPPQRIRLKNDKVEHVLLTFFFVIFIFFFNLHDHFLNHEKWSCVTGFSLKWFFFYCKDFWWLIFNQNRVNKSTFNIVIKKLSINIFYI